VSKAAPGAAAAAATAAPRPPPPFSSAFRWLPVLPAVISQPWHAGPFKTQRVVTPAFTVGMGMLWEAPYEAPMLEEDARLEEDRIMCSALRQFVAASRALEGQARLPGPTGVWASRGEVVSCFCCQLLAGQPLCLVVAARLEVTACPHPCPPVCC
jgi:hypothetical protein